MATQINPDGTVTEFKIGQDEEIEVKPKKGKRKGRAKQFDYERKIISAMVKKETVDELLAEFGSPTNAINAVIEFWKSNKK